MTIQLVVSYDIGASPSDGTEAWILALSACRLNHCRRDQNEPRAPFVVRSLFSALHNPEPTLEERVVDFCFKFPSL
jgi:hypothetical protein